MQIVIINKTFCNKKIGTFKRKFRFLYRLLICLAMVIAEPIVETHHVWELRSEAVVVADGFIAPLDAGVLPLIVTALLLTTILYPSF